MTPAELIQLCDDAIARWERGEMISEEPTIMLSVPMERKLRTDYIRLFGRRGGPLGYVATIKDLDGVMCALAYFPARKVKAAVERALK